MPHALVILPNNAAELSTVIDTIEQAGFTVSIANTLLSAKQMTGRLAPSIVFAEINMPDGNSFNLLTDNPWPKTTQIILLASTPQVDDALQAMRLGARDYLPFPLNVEHLKELVADLKATPAAARAAKEERDPAAVQNNTFAFEPYGYLVGESPSMHQLYHYMERVSPTNATVLIVGESGSGKELVAQTVHEKSLRAKGPYIAINCGAISKELISSALFGHEKGSFTGASQTHQGYFEQASGGTIFLDEITETSPDLQIRLLRVLETGKVIPVGGKRQINVDVRVIAATNRDPIEAVRAGVLREDLYYRLNTFPLNVPPLRKRPGDIVLLVNHFLEKLNKEYQRTVKIEQNALHILEQYSWPGNVRELKNIMQRAYILADKAITEEHIILGKPLRQHDEAATVNLDIGISLADAQQQLAEATLEHYGYDAQKAADALQITVKQLEQFLGKKTAKKLITNSRNTLKSTRVAKTISSELMKVKSGERSVKRDVIIA